MAGRDLAGKGRRSARALALVTLVGGALLAAPARAEARGHELSLGAATFSYGSFFRSSQQFLVLEAAYHTSAGDQGLWRNVRVGGGVRGAITPVTTYAPVEVFAQAQLTARIGIWEAAFGPELGLSGFARLNPVTLLPGRDVYAKEDQFVGPAYFAFSAAPVRLHLGRFVLGLLELSVGFSFPPLGSGDRMHLGLVTLGGLL